MTHTTLKKQYFFAQHTGKTKKELLDAIQYYSILPGIGWGYLHQIKDTEYTYNKYCDNGFYYNSQSNEPIFVVINFHKKRKVLISQETITKEWNGKMVNTTLRKYKPGSWVSKSYAIPETVLKRLNLKLTQHFRNFKITEL